MLILNNVLPQSNSSHLKTIVIVAHDDNSDDDRDDNKFDFTAIQSHPTPHQPNHPDDNRRTDGDDR